MAVAACRRTGPSGRISWSQVEHLPTTILVLGATGLGARRLAGALTVPPTLLAAATCAATFGGLVAAAVVLSKKYGHPVCRGSAVAQAVAAILAAAALTLPGISPGAVVLLWAPCVAAALVVASIFARPRYREYFQLGRRWADTLTRRTVGAKSADEAPFVDAAATEPPGLLPADACRLMLNSVRYFDAAGRDSLRGEATAPFAAGQRNATIHLSFCPPFATAPALTVECLEDMEAGVVASQILPYAARIEVKLTEPAEEPIDLRIAFKAAHPDAGS